MVAMEGFFVNGTLSLTGQRVGLRASVCMLILTAGAAMAQTEAPEPLPPATEAVLDQLERSATSDDSGAAAGIEVPDADADRTDQAGSSAAVGDDTETAGQTPLETVLPSPSGETPQPEEPAQPLREQIAACYTGDPAAESAEEVRISFVLDSAGLLRGIPSHVGSDTQSAVQRRVYLDAVVALEDCAPYSVSGFETTYEATFTPAAVGQVDVLRSEPQVTETEPLGTARVDRSAAVTEEDEAALDLTRDQRREIQNRLRLLEHDPGGADGVFGPNTRVAISNWQTEQGLAVSGYLNETQLAELRTQSETEYQAFLQTQPKPKPNRKAKRVRVCKRGVFGVLYDCRFVWR